MTWLEFFLSLFEAAVWPAVLAGTVFYLKDEFKNLFGKVKKLKYKGVEAEFNREIKEVIASSPQIPPTTTKKKDWNVTSTSNLDNNMMALVNKSPLAVVLQAWDIYQQEIHDISTTLSEKRRFCSSGTALVFIDKHNNLDSTFLNRHYRVKALVEKMKNHEGESVSKNRVLELSDLILDMKRVLSNKCKEKV